MGDSILYTEPETGAKIAAFNYLNESAEVEKMQKFQEGFQPVLSIADILEMVSDNTASNLYPFRALTEGSTSWTVSAQGSYEFYYTGGLLMSTGIVQITENGVDMTQAAPGSLSNGQFGVGNNDNLAADALYVHLLNDADPDSKADLYLRAVSTRKCKGYSHIFIQPAFTAADQEVTIAPILYPVDISAPLLQGGYNLKLAAPVIMDAQILSTSAIDLPSWLTFSQGYYGNSLIIPTYGADSFMIAVISPPTTGTVKLWTGVI